MLFGFVVQVASRLLIVRVAEPLFAVKLGSPAKLAETPLFTPGLYVPALMPDRLTLDSVATPLAFVVAVLTLAPLAVGRRWNISLFHCRNHGSDYLRVLAGVQVPPEERADFARHLAALGYAHWDETSNPAYRLFLGAADSA